LGKDEMIGFGSQKLKGQGHSMAKYAKNTILGFVFAIFLLVCISGFSPNVCQWSVLGQRRTN